ncbi:MAG TPA: colicin D domain-containing protein [Terriglobales bacterium]|nr:colicin D domain-containing protein [Terriglobales bacterium]
MTFSRRSDKRRKRPLEREEPEIKFPEIGAQMGLVPSVQEIVEKADTAGASAPAADKRPFTPQGEAARLGTQPSLPVRRGQGHTGPFIGAGDAARLGVEPTLHPAPASLFWLSGKRDFSARLDRLNRYGGAVLPGQQARIGATVTDKDTYEAEEAAVAAKKSKSYNDIWNEKVTGQPYANDFWGRLAGNYDLSRLNQDENDAWSRYIDDPTEANRAYAGQIGRLADELYANSEYIFDDYDAAGNERSYFDREVAAAAAAYLPQFLDQIAAMGTGAAAGGAGGWAVPVIGPLIGAQAGAVAGSGVYSYNQMRGAAYKGLLDAGVPEELAMAAATDEAVVSSLIEMADTGLDIAMLGFTQLASSLAQKGVRTLAKKGAGRAAQSALQKTIKALGKYGIDVLGEYGEEYIQSAVSMANLGRMASEGRTGALNLAGASVEKLLSMTPQERAKARRAGAEGFKAALLFGGLPAAVNHTLTNGVERMNVRGYGVQLRGAGQVETLIQEALKSPAQSEAYRRAAILNDALENGREPTDAELGRLYAATVAEAGKPPELEAKTGKIVNAENINYGQSSLDKAFSKHSAEFGTYPDGSNTSKEQFRYDINNLLETGLQKSGTYRAMSGTHVYNPSTRQWAFYDSSGNFVTAFKLGLEQFKYLIETGVVK